MPHRSHDEGVQVPDDLSRLAENKRLQHHQAKEPVISKSSQIFIDQHR